MKQNEEVEEKSEKSIHIYIHKRHGRAYIDRIVKTEEEYQNEYLEKKTRIEFSGNCSKREMIVTEGTARSYNSKWQ